MSTDAGASRRPHVLVVPLPSRGHLLPLLDFAHLLSTRHGILLTVAVVPSDLPLLSAFLASTPLAAALPLPLPDAASAKHARLDSLGAHHALLAAPLSALRAPLVSWARLQERPPTAVVSDFFLGWAQLVADDLRVPRVAFYGIGAFATAVIDHLWKSTPPPLDPKASVVLRDLPGSPSFPYEDLPSVVRGFVSGDPAWELAREGFLLNSRAWGAVVNTFDALEGDFLERLRRCSGYGRLWAVGPVAASGCRGRESLTMEAEELFSWLGACPARSVLYVCFGSMYRPSPAQAAALGAALEASGVRFVWAVGAGAAVPPEWPERIADRGRVVHGWLPQVEILRHAAVGAFVTHSGWNSTLEGVEAGVVLVAWPMKADQFINARLLADLHGAALRAAEGEASVPEATPLARVFADAVDGAERAGAVRAKASELAAAAAEAVDEGGSSWMDFQRMAKELEAIAVAAAAGSTS